MNLQRFTDERRSGWDELAALVARANGRAQTLPAADVLRVGQLYRSAAADLAQARREYPGEATTAHLDELVNRARMLVYGNVSRRESMVTFITRTYWQRVRERPRALFLAAAIMLLPAVGIGVWAHADPVRAERVAQLSQLTSKAGDGSGKSADRGFSTGKSASLASEIFTNNIRVAFVAFAGGLTGGIFTLVSLLLNGLILGLVLGLTIQAGNGSTAIRLIAPHGFLELSLITVSAAAGFRLGWAIISPGLLTRGQALAREARPAGEIALGTAIWLVPTGLVEGFITPKGLPLPVALGLGMTLALVFWGLVIWRGAPDVTPAPST